MMKKEQNYLKQQIIWTRTRDLSNPFETIIENNKLTIKLNDFFDGDIYTLIVNDQEYIDFDEWPQNWIKPPSDIVNVVIKKIIELQVKIHDQEKISRLDLEILVKLLQKVPPISID